jgi:hypothetical protein
VASRPEIRQIRAEVTVRGALNWSAGAPCVADAMKRPQSGTASVAAYPSRMIVRG